MQRTWIYSILSFCSLFWMCLLPLGQAMENRGESEEVSAIRRRVPDSTSSPPLTPVQDTLDGNGNPPSSPTEIENQPDSQREARQLVLSEETEVFFKNIDRMDPHSILSIQEKYSELDELARKRLWPHARQALALCTGLRCESDTSGRLRVRASRTFFDAHENKYKKKLEDKNKAILDYQLRTNMVQKTETSSISLLTTLDETIRTLRAEKVKLEIERSHFTTKKNEIDESRKFQGVADVSFFNDALKDPFNYIANTVNHYKEYRYTTDPHMYAFAYLPDQEQTVQAIIKLLQENDPFSHSDHTEEEDAKIGGRSTSLGLRTGERLNALLKEFKDLDENVQQSYWPESWFKLAALMGLECHKDGTTSLSRTTMDNWIAEVDQEIIHLKKKIQEHEDDIKAMGADEPLAIDGEIKGHLNKEIARLRQLQQSAEEDRAYIEKTSNELWHPGVESNVLYAKGPSLFVLPFVSPTVLPQHQGVAQSLVDLLYSAACKAETTLTTTEFIISKFVPREISFFGGIAPLDHMPSYAFSFPSHPSEDLKNRDVELESTIRINSNGDTVSRVRQATAWFSAFEELAKRTGLEVVKANDTDTIRIQEGIVVVPDFRLALSFEFFRKLEGIYRHQMQAAYDANDMASWRRLLEAARFFSNLAEDHQKPNPTFFRFQKNGQTSVVSFTFDTDGRKYLISNDKGNPFHRPCPFVFAVLSGYHDCAEKLVGLLIEHDPRPTLVPGSPSYSWAQRQIATGNASSNVDGVSHAE